MQAPGLRSDYVISLSCVHTCHCVSLVLWNLQNQELKEPLFFYKLTQLEIFHYSLEKQVNVSYGAFVMLSLLFLCSPVRPGTFHTVLITAALSCFKVTKFEASNLVLSQDCFGYSGSLAFPYRFYEPVVDC